MKRFYLIFLILFFATSQLIFSQINKGGTPPSFDLGLSIGEVDKVIVPQLDMNLVLAEDGEDEKNGDFLRSGRSIPVSFNMQNAGTWTELRDGSKVWRLTVNSKDAQALSLVYQDFYLPVGSKLFVYNKHQTHVLGAFTNENNMPGSLWSHELVQGDEITLEYYQPKRVAGMARINITEVVYVYRNAEILNRYDPAKTTGWGASEVCEVNINCSPVGDNWQDEKRGVAEIWLRVGAGWGWCSGTLVNNTSYDGTPYFLTADHCGGTDASDADLLVWSFYFNYEAADCTTPGTEPAYQTLTGAVRRAVGPISGGSDFFLLELNNTPGAAINPYYNGWDRTTATPASGTGIHHPAGDIKKISTSTWMQTAGPVNIGGDIMAANSVFEIEWSANANGWGVTEGGSSGSPLFNSAGLQVGTLSGGSSFCTAQSSHDYYGRFWYHWDQNPGGTATQLRTWLDPGNTGVTTLPGYDPFATAPPTVDFYGTPTIILQGETVDFTDASYGTPFSAHNWTFESGTPGTANVANPTGITYNTPGTFDVTESVTNAFGTTSETKTGYIRVLSNSVETCDTIMTFYGTPTIYTSTNGYVGGTNEYGCEAIAEKFSNVHPFNEISGGRFYWASANNGTSPNVTFVIWGADASGNPGAQLATTTVPLATIVNDYNTNGYTDVDFGTSVSIPTNGAFLGFMIPGTPASGDTLAIVTNNDADSNDDTGYSYYGGWETYDAWGMSLMNLILPFACYDPFLPPVADFSGTPRLITAGGTVDYTDLSYGGAATSWAWVFDGGTPGTSTAQNPTNITYNTPGFYQVSLTATNANGSDIETKTSYIEVLDPNACNCGELSNVVGGQVVYTTAGGYLAGSNEYADLSKAEYFDSYAPYTLIEGAWIRFGAVTNTTGGNITVNLWNANGGASAGGDHTYSPGTILATATVPLSQIETDVANGDSTYIDFPSVTIPGNFFIGFMIPTPAAGSDSIAVFTGVQGAGTDNGWEQWSPSGWYSYTEAGWGGSFNNAIFPHVCTQGSPAGEFMADNTTIVEGGSVNFTDLSMCSPTSWSWTFEGGTPGTSTAQNPTNIVYNTPGTYDVTLTVTNADGSGTEYKADYITVTVAPIDIVNWNFPGNPDDAVSDGGIPVNNGTRTLSTVGGTAAPVYNIAGATTRAASATGWDAGANTKYWMVSFETTGYQMLKLSSKQTGNNNRSPRDFKVQYSIDGSAWTDVPGATVTCATNNWNSTG
ncbi:MAG: PKD domain-containing protein, partial [Bacteroidales bacterium]|nr:PKD domain-containing protein [Bacteroidales bacterium]